MDLLKKLKNHYEKVLLGAVLIGLAVAVGFLPLKIGSERTKLTQLTETVTHPTPKPLTNLDLTTIETMLKKAGSPVVVSFSAPHKLFNPMPWQKAAEGKLIPFDDTHIGPKAIEITKLSPLALKLTLDSVQVVDSGPKYVVGIEKEAAVAPRDRMKKQTYCSPGAKNDTFTLRQVEGPPENPTNLVLELKEGDVANVAKERPFSRIDGYMADLKYEPEKKTWRNQRVGASIAFNGEDYSIVTVNQNEVVISAKSNQKKWTIKNNPNATPEPR
jgi:hypothetical protein